MWNKKKLISKRRVNVKIIWAETKMHQSFLNNWPETPLGLPLVQHLNNLQRSSKVDSGRKQNVHVMLDIFLVLYKCWNSCKYYKTNIGEGPHETSYMRNLIQFGARRLGGWLPSLMCILALHLHQNPEVQRHFKLVQIRPGENLWRITLKVSVSSSQHRSRRMSADQLAKSDSNMSRCQCVKLTLCVITLNIWSSQISYKKQQFFCSTTGSFYSGAPELQKFSKRKQNSEGHRNIK